MDHYSLKLFLTLAQTLHFGKAGQICNISPSALSRQVQRMEQAVGQQLFERDNRSVQLTPAGHLFRSYAVEVLEKWQDLMEEISGEEKILRGEISIYCSVTASLSILPDLLSRFKTAYPEVHIRLQTGDAAMAVRKVASGEMDLAVAALPERVPDVLEFRILTQVSLVFIAPKTPWEFSHALSPDIQWEQIPMILSQRGLARQRIDRWFAAQKIQPNIYAQVSGNEAILSMVSLGCGVGVVPTLVIENSPLNHRIVTMDVTPHLVPYEVGICALRRQVNRRILAAFWEMIK